MVIGKRRVVFDHIDGLGCGGVYEAEKHSGWSTDTTTWFREVSLGIRAYSRLLLILEGAAFVKRKTPLLWPMRGVVYEKLSDGVPKDQISALAHSNMVSKGLK
jgi:hypothetical protein